MRTDERLIILMLLNHMKKQEEDKAIELLKDKEVRGMLSKMIQPVTLAADSDCPKIVEFLLDEGEKIEGDWANSSPLHFAIRAGNKKVVEILLEKGASTKASWLNEAPLYTAIQTGNLEIVKLLLAHGANIEGGRTKPTPLSVAVQKGHVGIVKTLLQQGANTSNLKLDGSTTSPEMIFTILNTAAETKQFNRTLVSVLASTKTAFTAAAYTTNNSENLQNHVSKIYNWLTHLKNQIISTEWKVKKNALAVTLSGDKDEWVAGIPKHIKALTSILKKVNDNDPLNTLKSFTQIIKVLSDVAPSKNRHSDTEAFYQSMQMATQQFDCYETAKMFSFENVSMPFCSMPVLQSTVASMQDSNPPPSYHSLFSNRRIPDTVLNNAVEMLPLSSSAKDALATTDFMKLFPSVPKKAVASRPDNNNAQLEGEMKRQASKT